MRKANARRRPSSGCLWSAWLLTIACLGLVTPALVLAEGTGVLGTLEVHHVAATTDIREGDLLVTSGLGGRFPVGYPVAVVSEVERDPGQPFARILARPSAALDRSRHVLLVFTAGHGRES